jgi:hypothetical protein
VAGDSVVGEEIRRVGENEVDGIFGQGGEDIEAIALEDADVMFVIAEDGVGQMRFRSRIDWYGIQLSGFAHSGGLGREKCDRPDR